MVPAKSIKVTEANFLDTVLELAQRTGWTRAHFRPAYTGKGYRTPVQADGAGFPDLFLAKPSHYLVLAELKSDTGKMTEEQEHWRDILELSLGIRYFLWRPRDWGEIVKVLQEPAQDTTSRVRQGIAYALAQKMSKKLLMPDKRVRAGSTLKTSGTEGAIKKDSLLIWLKDTNEHTWGEIHWTILGR